MFRTTLKTLAARKLRLFTTSFAVLLGVAFMAGTLVLTDTIGKTFDALYANVNKGTDAYVRAEVAFDSDWFGQQFASEEGTQVETGDGWAAVNTPCPIAEVPARLGKLVPAMKK
jgi:hypothetical protein